MADLTLAFEAAIVGHTCRAERREADWVFDFENGIDVAVGCNWRLVLPEHLALTNEDDGQLFGLPTPVDAETKANALLNDATVSFAVVDRVTADLCIRFSNELRLDLLNNSSGYEAWQGRFRYDEREVSMIALGGGGVAFF